VTTWRLPSLAAVVAGALLAACDGGGGGGGGGPAGPTVAGSVANGVIRLPVSIEGTAAQPFIVDTGSVLTRVDPTRYEELRLAPGLAQVTTLDVGSLHLTNVDVIAASLCGPMMTCRGSEPAGLLGGAVLLDVRVTIDYRASTVTFGDFATPAGVGAPVTAPFALEGGGAGMVSGAPVTLPATRVVLDVEVEGASMRMVLDTGSSTIILRPDLYDALVADGRAQSTIDLGTVAGARSVPLTHVRTFTLAGATQADVEAVRAPLPVDPLEREVGHRIDGLVGGAYLQHYATTIDYPGHLLTLQAYDDAPSPAP
jgi:hypothetical protein